MTVTGLGHLMQVILPVRVEHDREATLGVRLVIPGRSEWDRVMSAGRQGGGAWAGLQFAGRLVTVVQPWPQIFGAWTQALVPGPDQALRLVHSHDRLLAEVLAISWPEDVIRSARTGHEPSQASGGPTPNPYAELTEP